MARPSPLAAIALAALAAALTGAPGAARAALCDHTPSRLVDRTRAGLTTTIAEARSGLEERAAGYFALGHADLQTGLILGAQAGADLAGAGLAGAAGAPSDPAAALAASGAASAAADRARGVATATGTGLLLSGTAGLVGTVGAMLSAPVTALLGGVALVGLGAFEGACYFAVERVTAPYEVRSILENVAAHDPGVMIAAADDGLRLILPASEGPAGATRSYLLRDLYIADGHLKHRDLGRDTDLGPILFAVSAPSEDSAGTE